MEKAGLSRAVRLTLLAAGMSLAAACASVEAPPASDDVATDGGPPIIDRSEPDIVVVDPSTGPCAAQAYQVLVGQPIGEVDRDSLPVPHRIYGVGDMITMDYRPDRMNIVTDEDGVVAEVKCG